MAESEIDNNYMILFVLSDNGLFVFKLCI